MRRHLARFGQAFREGVNLWSRRYSPPLKGPVFTRVFEEFLLLYPRLHPYKIAPNQVNLIAFQGTQTTIESIQIQRGAPIADGLAVGIGDRAVVKFCRIGERRRHLKLVERVILPLLGALRTVARGAAVVDV